MAYWCISKYILRDIVKELGLTKEFVKTYAERYSSSINLLDSIIKSSFNDKEFYVFDFSFYETLKAIKDEIKTLYLFKNGVPISKWSREQTVEISNEIRELVYDKYNRAMDRLFKNDNVKLLRHPMEEERDWDVFFDVYSFLLLGVPNLSTQDAIIISGAIVSDINYIVSSDTALKKLNEQINEVFKEEKIRVEIIDPSIALKL